MISGEVKVLNKLGLHARAAAKVVQTASAYESKIKIVKGDQEADAKGIMRLMMLAATQGMTLTVSVDGADEDEAFIAMQNIFNNQFGESE